MANPVEPKRVDGRRRKTDGTTFITESPDLSSAKYPDASSEAVPATPRTMRARDSLRRKAFYADSSVSEGRGTIGIDSSVDDQQFSPYRPSQRQGAS